MTKWKYLLIKLILICVSKYEQCLYFLRSFFRNTTYICDVMPANMNSIKVDELLESPIFQCKNCENRLSKPIMNVPNIGNICGRCFKKNTYNNAQENTDLSNILSKLKVPCCYRKHGCLYQGLFSETTVHEDVCKYKEKVCPFSFINKCNKVPISSVNKHIRTEHLQHIHPYSSNKIEIEFSLEHEFEDFRLLILNENEYLLRIKLDHKQNSLCFLIYYFEHNENNFYIGHENENVSIKNVPCSMVPELFLTCIFDFKSASKFDLSMLKKCFNSTITTVVTVSMPKFLISNSKLLKLMECPVCNEFMNLQIIQCHQGHSICKICRQKLQECPLCKSGFGNARNYTLESVSSLIYFPCKNNGCTRYISGEEIPKHEQECKHKYYQCPFLIKLNCKWKGLHEDITKHLMFDHAEFTEFNDFVERKITLDYINHKYDTICIILGNIIFKVCVCINGTNKLFLTYGFYGPTSQEYTFDWETGIYHKNSDKHKFVVKDICSSYMTTNYKLDIEGYGVDDTIYFYHKITQKYN